MSAEPQNALTQKFTQAEWDALKELRVSMPLSEAGSTYAYIAQQAKLPEIWKAAYAPDDATATPKPITLWGITIDPENPTNDARVSVVLMKWLRARCVVVRSAAVT
jgi:phosphatidylinositol transfer protein SFH5